MPVDRFAGSVGKFPGMGVAVLSDLDRAQVREFPAGQFMFHIEVGCDDKEAIVTELTQCALEHPGPEDGVVPEILVAHESEIKPFAG